MPFSHLSSYQFINVETFRKSGAGVKTPVWFAMDDQAIYVRTRANSGKVKRARSNGQARVAPCKNNGEVLGDWLDARIRLAQGSEVDQANHLFNRKYGLTKRFFDMVNFFSRETWDTLVIQPVEETTPAAV